MESSAWKICVWAMSTLLISACSPPDNSMTTVDDTLFEIQPVTVPHSLWSLEEEGVVPFLKTLLNDPATSLLYVVKVNPALIAADTKRLTIAIPGAAPVRFNRKRVNQEVTGMIGWIGDVASDRKQRFASSSEVDMDPFNWISILRHGDRLVGSIHVGGQSYRLEYIGAGQHVLVKLDESKLAPDGEPVVIPTTENHEGKRPQSEHSTIRVLFVTTDQSRARYPDYKFQLVQLLQDANQYMINSQVAITYQLAGFYDAQFDEAGRDSAAQLGQIRSTSTELGKAVYVERDALRADLVAMLSTFTEVCGRASLTATKTTAYSVFSCVGATLSHELGHNLGVHHGWEPGDAARNPPYMHGYRQTMPRFHTLMTTSHGAIPYFSNPRLHYQGAPMGTVEHNDAARRLNERRETVEGFYP
ncbi:hypothetical protein D3C81_542910 [compost metagenome]